MMIDSFKYVSYKKRNYKYWIMKNHILILFFSYHVGWLMKGMKELGLEEVSMNDKNKHTNIH
jgi:hypothetical protein